MSAAALALHLAEPRALWGLALLVPVLAAHLLRRKRRRVVVPFAPLLLEARARAGAGGLGSNLVDRAALAARLLALAALALALAGPSPQAPPDPVPLALVIDADPTTAAREDDGRPRLAHALALAAALTRAHAEGPVHALLAVEAPVRLSVAGEDRHALAARLAGGAGSADLGERERPRPAAGRADLAAATALARGLVGPGGRVRLLTAREVETRVAAPEEVLGVGATDDDQGLVDLALRSDPGSEKVLVEVRVKNFARAACARAVELRLDGRPILRRELELAAGREERVAFAFAAPDAGGLLSVRLEGRDRLERNDGVEAVLPARRKIHVLAVHDGRGLRPYTAALLASMPELDRQASRGVTASELEGAGPRDVTLVDGAALPPGALTPGAWLFLAPLAGALPFAVAPPVERPLVWRARAGHPLVRDLDLADAWVTRGWPIRAGEGVTGLAFASDEEPVLAEGERGGVRWVALGLDPEASDLPLRAAFPLLLRNALVRLAEAPRDPLPPFAVAGAALLARVPLPGGPRARLAWGPGHEARVRLSPEEGWPVPAGVRGLLEVETLGEPAWRGRTALVGLEPDLSIAPARPPAATPPPREDPPDVAARMARLLAALAALLLGLDLWLTRRGAAGSVGPAVAMSEAHGSIAPWSTPLSSSASSARP